MSELRKAGADLLEELALFARKIGFFVGLADEVEQLAEDDSRGRFERLSAVIQLEMFDWIALLLKGE